MTQQGIRQGAPYRGDETLQHNPAPDEGAEPLPFEGQTQAIRLGRGGTVPAHALPFVQVPPPSPPARKMSSAPTPAFGAPPAAPWPQPHATPLPPPPPAMQAPLPPPMPPPPPIAPPVVQAPLPATIGEQFALQQQWSSGEAHVPPAPAEAPAPRRAALPAVRPLELLWAADDAEQQARRSPLTSDVFGAPTGEDRATSRRVVHRAIARLAPADDLARTLWDAVDEDGVLSTPVTVVAGEIELLFDDAEYAKTLAPLARPLAEGDGELEERIDAVALAAERLPESPSAAARALAALRRAWAEREVAVPLEEVEAEARLVLLKKRRLRTLTIFEAVHVAARLHTDAHDGPVPVYLPETARGRLPLEDRFDARLLVELHPRQAADEGCPVAVAALAIARVVRA